MWKEIALSDREWMKERLDRFGCALSDYSFSNCLIWNAKRRYCFKVIEGCLVIRYTLNGEEVCLMPIGPWSRSLFQALLEEMPKVRLRAISEERLQELCALFPAPVKYAEDPDHFDYLYSFDVLLHLSGNALQPKRNLIHQFEKDYQWTYEAIDKNHLPELIKLQKEWILEHEANSALLDEHHALLTALNEFQALKLCGGCLKVEEKYIAYTIGELLTPDTLLIHGEKALAGFKGAYQMINRQFLMHSKPVAFVNREEALGIHSLERAKSSYHPLRLLKKFTLRAF